MNNNATLFIRKLQRALTYKKQRISELEKEAKIKDKLIEDLSELVTESYHEGYREGVNGDTYLGAPYDQSNIAIDLSRLMLTIHQEAV
jgi:hypothetical protein